MTKNYICTFSLENGFPVKLLGYSAFDEFKDML